MPWTGKRTRGNGSVEASAGNWPRVVLLGARFSELQANLAQHALRGHAPLSELQGEGREFVLIY